MKNYLRIYRNNRPVHWPKYILDFNNRTVETNSKEEIKMFLDLNGMKMDHFRGFRVLRNDINLCYLCVYD